jgi:hypothetical protein
MLAVVAVVHGMPSPLALQLVALVALVVVATDKPLLEP